MKVRIVHRPTGCINGQVWPKAGGTIDLPNDVAEGMIRTGTVEKVGAEKVEKPVETRPAPTDKVETRKPAPKGK